MKFFDIDPLIDKIKKDIKKSDKILSIFTDTNEDNISYCNSIKKINDKNEFCKDIEIINISNENDFNKVIIGPISELEKHKYFIMNSCIQNETLQKFFMQFPYLCYSEIMGNRIYPTPNAIVDTILHYFNNDLSKIVITVANRSNLIGKPLVNKLIDLNATINWVHTKSSTFYKNQCFIESDCIVTAAGVPNEFNICNYDRPQLIVDAGINVVEGKVCGDWNLDQLKTFDNITITKNPGGIGKLTTYELFKEICNG